MTLPIGFSPEFLAERLDRIKTELRMLRQDITTAQNVNHAQRQPLEDTQRKLNKIGAEIGELRLI